MSSNNITFVTNFVKIGKLVHKFKWRRQKPHSDITNLLLFLINKVWIKIYRAMYQIFTLKSDSQRHDSYPLVYGRPLVLPHLCFLPSQGQLSKDSRCYATHTFCCHTHIHNMAQTRWPAYQEPTWPFNRGMSFAVHVVCQGKLSKFRTAFNNMVTQETVFPSSYRPL
jgi:hypothetical protein